MSPPSPSQALPDTVSDAQLDAPAAAALPDLVAQAAALRDRLAGWYHSRRRRLPWREEPTPYRVWVSEIMLQQTRVTAVLPYFQRFLEAFPTVQALAAAPLDDVLTLWAGLGYYRRARNLHAAAQQVVAQHGGALPADPAALRTLPGVGRYTTAAIASVAFGLPLAVLDGNVARVLARLVALPDPVDAAPGRKRLWELAQALLDPADPSSHNQAMMELGALTCTPTSPACDACPLRPHCAARAAGEPTRYPIKRPRRQAKRVYEVAAFVRRQAVGAQGACVAVDQQPILLAKRPAEGLLAGFWGLPSVPVAPRGARGGALAEGLQEALGVRVAPGRRLARVEHVFTHRHLLLDVLDAALTTDRDLPVLPAAAPYAALRWVAPGQLGELPLSALDLKVLESVGVPA